MATQPIVIDVSWTAFVKDKSCLTLKEFPKGGRYSGTLTLISKPTEAELKAELKRLKISLPV